MVSLNKKGLTMIELIAVIAIIGIIIVLIATNVFRTQRDIQGSLFCTQVSAIEQGAILWGNNNRSQLVNICSSAGTGCTAVVPLNSPTSAILAAIPASNTNTRVSLQTLVTGGYLEGDANNNIIDPRTNESMPMNQTVVVFIRNNRVAAAFPNNGECS